MDNFNISDLSILLVEPSSTQRKLIVNELDDAGVMEIEAVDCGEVALQRIPVIHPDLVISSLYLADMTGTDLINSIRNQELTKDVPFMLVSSEKSFKRLDPIRQAGVVAILPKPFSSIELKRALQSTVEFVQGENLELSNQDISKLEVLVVDDSRMARRHIQRVLQDMGIINMTTAKNGKEAVQLFEQNSFDLVVTDLNMPEMDGNQLIDYIRKHSNKPHTPILMVTSEDNQARLSNVEQSGVSAICDKPFEPLNVKEILQRILQ